MKKEWKNIEEVYDELNKCYDKRRCSLMANKLCLWIVWFREIKFFKINRYGEIETIYSIFFKENQETRKKGDYSYLDELIEWDYLIKRKRLFDKEEAEEFMKKLRKKWIRLKKEWKNINEVFREIDIYYHTQSESLYQHKLFLRRNWIDEIEFYREKKAWNREIIAFINLKKIKNQN